MTKLCSARRVLPLRELVFKGIDPFSRLLSASKGAELGGKMIKMLELKKEDGKRLKGESASSDFHWSCGLVRVTVIYEGEEKRAWYNPLSKDVLLHEAYDTTANGRADQIVCPAGAVLLQVSPGSPQSFAKFLLFENVERPVPEKKSSVLFYGQEKIPFSLIGNVVYVPSEYKEALGASLNAELFYLGVNVYEAIPRSRREK